MACVLSLAGLNKAEVLAALYNASKPQGMGFIQYDPTPMTSDEAQELLDSGQTYFDYVKGRVMKVDLSGDELNTRGYDRDNGENAAQQAIAALNQTGSSNSVAAQTMHYTGKAQAAQAVRVHLREGSSFEGGVFQLGLADVADVLGPAVDKALQEDKS